MTVLVLTGKITVEIMVEYCKSMYTSFGDVPEYWCRRFGYSRVAVLGVDVLACSRFVRHLLKMHGQKLKSGCHQLKHMKMMSSFCTNDITDR